MQYLKEKALERVDINSIAQFAGLASVAMFLPYILHIQWITGPIVNAVLILTLLKFGFRNAITLAVFPSLMALSGGLLPVVLAPVVPFIMISNMILISCVDWCCNNFKDKTKGYWSGVIIGASLKFLFLFLSINVISGLLIRQEFAIKVAQMMSWPQFYTAVIGGVIAWGVWKRMK
ncbi:iron hydrogenase [Patescibacteria group bacterium]|nr:iron hydrogenase [Patescibacteria group bacterium]